MVRGGVEGGERWLSRHDVDLSSCYVAVSRRQVSAHAEWVKVKIGQGPRSARGTDSLMPFFPPSTSTARCNYPISLSPAERRIQRTQRLSVHSRSLTIRPSTVCGQAEERRTLDRLLRAFALRPPFCHSNRPAPLVSNILSSTRALGKRSAIGSSVGRLGRDLDHLTTSAGLEIQVGFSRGRLYPGQAAMYHRR